MSTYDSTLPADPMRGAVGVKPLEWSYYGGSGDWIASPIRNWRYIVGRFSNGWRADFEGSIIGGYHESSHEAKAAAQADYEQRILSAFVQPPATAPLAQVTRWVLRIDWGLNQARMEPDAEGGYVLSSDYDALSALIPPTTAALLEGVTRYEPRVDDDGRYIGFVEDADGRVVSYSDAARIVADVEARAEKASELLGSAREWAEKRSELMQWTGSAWIAGEATDDLRRECYSFLCGLIGWLQSAEDAAAALSQGGHADGDA